MLNSDELNSPNALVMEHHPARTIPGVSPSRITTPHSLPPKKTKWGRWIFLLAIVGVAFWALLHRPLPQTAPPPPKKTGPGAVSIPVVSGVVTRKDIPIYLDGLGTVQAFNSVTVRSRVDGQIVKIVFNEGQDVKTGDVLLQIDPNPYKAALDQAMGKKGQDVAMLANAELDKKRYDDLLKRNVIASQQKDTQDALERQLTAAVNADDATIEAAQVQLDYTTIKSPIDGRVGIRLVDVGNVIHAADTNGVVVVTQLRPIYVVFTLPEQSLASIQKETSKEPMKVIAVDRDNNSTLSEGVLSVVDNTIDVTTGTIKLKATFENKDLSLWPGQFVNARLLVSVRKNGIAVPASVIQRGPDSTYAFVIKKDQTVEIRPVKVGQIEDGQALIESGLEAGEKVVVDGQYRLQPGSLVAESVKGAKGGEVKQQKAPQ
jgi:multidrug efflux system membrane fusion protein